MAGQGKVEIEIGAVDKASPKLKGIGQQIDKMGKSFATVGKGMMAVGAGIVGSLGAMAFSYTKTGDAVRDMAIKTGFSTEAISELKYISELTGMSIDGLEIATRKMSIAIIEAGTSLDYSKTSLGQLGLTLEEIRAMSPEKQFETIADALAGVEDQTLQVALATDLFGSAGTDLLPMLAESKDSIAAMKQEARDLNLVFSQESADAADKFEDSKTKLTGSLNGIKNSIATAVLPAISELVQKLTNGLKPVLEWIKNNPAVFEGILKFGAAILAAGGLLFGISKAIAAFNAIRNAIIGISVAFTILQGITGVGLIKVAAGLAAAAALSAAIIKLSSMGGGGGGELESYPNPEGFHSGGTVPGPMGKPTLVLAHGGEQFGGMNNAYKGGVGGGINVTVNVAGSIKSDRELVQFIREELLKVQNRNFSLGFS